MATFLITNSSYCVCFGELRFLRSRIGMSLSRTWKYQLDFSLCFCCFLLLVAPHDYVTDPDEVDALKAIKLSLVDRNGNLSDWNRGDPCGSNWTGIVCHMEPLVDGYLHVQELQLLNMNLSGTLAPEIGRLAYLTILCFMWNYIGGSIPKEIGNIRTLEILLLNGNQLTGPLPVELGYLKKLNRMQIDQNKISGTIPASFANLHMIQHFHLNNNSISGQIPRELSRLPNLAHFLLDNNNLSGHLPPELSEMPSLRIIQLDNNNFSGTTIPQSYANMSHLLKMSLRNCSLQGPVPDLSRIPRLSYLDLSSNQLRGSIPPNKLSDSVTTIDLSNNNLSGTIPSYFSRLPRLQRLSIANNFLNDSIPSAIWQNKTLNATDRLMLEFQYNNFSSISGSTSLPPNVSLWLEGNPLCSNDSLVQFCELEANDTDIMASTNSNVSCPIAQCPPPYEYSPVTCFCAAPLIVEYRLKSPGFSAFSSYRNLFENYLSNGIDLFLHQLNINTYFWEEGPRLRMLLKLFPVYDVQNQSPHTFNRSEVLRLRNLFTGWLIPESNIFGPYELLSFRLLDNYKDLIGTSKQSSGISKGALVGIIIGAIACAVIISAIVSLVIFRVLIRGRRTMSKRHQSSKTSIEITGVRPFTYGEMVLATNNFSESAQVGEGGFGVVYQGIFLDGSLVAIKRASKGSLQGEEEFLTEIRLLSKLHHRNLVSLIGYCDEEGEQMLVYEYMSNGTLRNHLSANSTEALSFARRIQIALGSARGILYLHTEIDPPIIHRDIKSSNILLDSEFTAKVADFGLSRLGPVPNVKGIVPSHVTTGIKGTPGYMDPQYFLTRQLTDKSDVYSLGVVFLELVTGKQAISHGKNIVTEVNKACQSGEIFSIIDERMVSCPPECIKKFLALSLNCCNEEADARPKIAQVVRELEDIWSMMPDFDTEKAEFINPSEPGNMVDSSSAIETLNGSANVLGEEIVNVEMSTIRPR